MSARPEQVLYELLARGFRAYPRGILNGFLFGILIVVFVWPRLPHGFLVAWLAVGFALGLARLRLSRGFMRSRPPAGELDKWTRYAAIGYGATGLMWGVMGAATIHFAADARQYILVVAFLIMLFALLNMQATAAHPAVFRAFLFSAMAPIIVVSAVEPAPPEGNYYLRLVLEFLILAVTLAVGRSGNRYVTESIVMRYENVELLQELTRQKEELDKANAAKTHFLAAASHDLRQPMQALVLLVESLRERVTEPETRRIVKNIRSSVTEMAALLNGILDISRFDAGTVKPERAHFPVRNVLDRVRSTFAELAARHELALRVAPSSAVVESDPILLYRIVANIATNALRYTDRGTVLVGCRRREDGVEIQVWDTGPGIAAADIPEIFREFYQLGNPQRDREQGLGLGLAIVERTAKLLGHPLAVRSRVGRGSLFSVLVPYGDAREIHAHARLRATDSASLEGCSVLVVEDEREIRAAMTILLEGWGCEVVAASSGPEAHALLDGITAAPDVILADYRLSGEDNGIRVIRGMRMRFPQAVGILISGDIAPHVLKEAELAGVRLLHKPLRPARLRSLLGNVWREHAGAKRASPQAESA
jgi:signal transduction histidine kinase/ActR/RegA family two-component response regulator